MVFQISSCGSINLKNNTKVLIFIISGAPFGYLTAA
jgi:hypothetical protein